jgi:hypothetical protein
VVGRKWPFDKCQDGRVPLAAQEMLAIVVLAQWIKLGRVASQSSTLGPLFQCVGVFSADIGKWIILTTWPLVVRQLALNTCSLTNPIRGLTCARVVHTQAFTSCFNVLFREPCTSPRRIELSL